MADRLTRCAACDGRGYHRCECWPGDCICGWDDQDCEECGGEGWIDPSYDYPDGPWTPEEWREVCTKAEKEAEAAGLKDVPPDARDAEIARLREALHAIADDASVPQQMYDRNGPQWTSPQGNEYEDTSAHLAKCNEIAEQARAAITTTGTVPSSRNALSGGEGE